jgi:hypothetical protein
LNLKYANIQKTFGENKIIKRCMNRTVRVSSATAKARLPARRSSASDINNSRDAPATAEMPATTWAF